MRTGQVNTADATSPFVRIGKLEAALRLASAEGEPLPDRLAAVEEEAARYGYEHA